MPGVGNACAGLIKMTMYQLIEDIAARCHAAATKRGKDTSCVGCIAALQRELGEYWEAVEKGRKAAILATLTEGAANLSDEEFNALYEAEIHNTAEDELADLLITAATWLHTAKTEGGESYRADRSIDAMLLSGAVQFVAARITCENDVRRVQQSVNLKMRFNETRKD